MAAYERLIESRTGDDCKSGDALLRLGSGALRESYCRWRRSSCPPAKPACCSRRGGRTIRNVRLPTLRELIRIRRGWVYLKGGICGDDAFDLLTAATAWLSSMRRGFDENTPGTGYLVAALAALLPQVRHCRSGARRRRTDRVLRPPIGSR